MQKEEKSYSKKLRDKKKKSRYRQLHRLEKILGVRFKDMSFLIKALTHRSAVNESGSHLDDNERLEHLGDSVLGFVISDYLYKHFKNYQEGNLAKIKSVLVSDNMLANKSKLLNIGSYIVMGKGEEISGGRNRISILANTMESIIGAIYLDSGIKKSRKFVLNLLKQDIEKVGSLTNIIDPKTELREIVQKKYKESPIYKVINEIGPAHQKEFVVRLIINGNEITTGRGGSKRKAEMNAAKSALERVNKEEFII